MSFVHAWVALFKRRAFKTKDAAAQMRRAAGDNDLRKCLGPFDLIMLGIGGIIGAGVFVLTGVAANELAGWASDAVLSAPGWQLHCRWVLAACHGVFGRLDFCVNLCKLTCPVQAIGGHLVLDRRICRAAVSAVLHRVCGGPAHRRRRVQLHLPSLRGVHSLVRCWADLTRDHAVHASFSSN